MDGLNPRGDLLAGVESPSRRRARWAVGGAVLLLLVVVGVAVYVFLREQPESGCYRPDHEAEVDSITAALASSHSLPINTPEIVEAGSDCDSPVSSGLLILNAEDGTTGKALEAAAVQWFEDNGWDRVASGWTTPSKRFDADALEADIVTSDLSVAVQIVLTSID